MNDFEAWLARREAARMAGARRRWASTLVEVAAAVTLAVVLLWVRGAR